MKEGVRRGEDGRGGVSEVERRWEREEERRKLERRDTGGHRGGEGEDSRSSSYDSTWREGGTDWT